MRTVVRSERPAIIALMLAALTVWPFVLAVQASASADDVVPRALRFEPSGIKGGGFFTSVTIAPGTTDTIVLAGGNSGYHRSVDLGAHFEARNRDLVTLPLMRVASVTYHPSRPGVLYGATGSRGRDGGFARSTDDGLTWEVRSTEPRFAGQDNSMIADLPEHPRSTGSLIAAHEDVIWVGTFDQGVMRSRDEGRTWEVVGLPGAYIRSLVRHPTDPSRLYVSSWRGGVQVTDDALDEHVSFAPLPGAPGTVEELAFVGRTLYAAAGAEGLYRIDERGWTRLHEGVPAGSTWTAIAGIEFAGEHVLFAGCYACAPDDDGHRATIIRSLDSGESWHNVTRPQDLDFRVVGSGERWSMADGVPAYMPGREDAIVSQIVIKPVAAAGPQGFMVIWAGRGGAWRSLDAGATWAPIVNGLAEANSEGLALDPADPTRAFQGAVHFGIQVSEDGFTSTHVDAFDAIPPLADRLSPTAHWTAFDTSTSPSTVIVAAADHDAVGVGGIYATSDPYDRDGWVDLGFTAAAPGQRPTSIAVGRDADGHRVVVAAAHPRGGIWRSVADGSWQRVEGTDAFAGKSPPKSDLLWLTGSPVIYAYDLGYGVFRSTDGGRSFEPVWEHPSTRSGTGALAASPEDPGTLFVAAEDGLYRLDQADAGSVAEGEVQVVRLVQRVIGDVFLSPSGGLWAVAHPGAGSPTTVLLLPDPSGVAPAVIEYSDEVLANTMVVPQTLALAPDGVVLVGGLRSGTLRGVPVETETLL